MRSHGFADVTLCFGFISIFGILALVVEDGWTHDCLVGSVLSMLAPFSHSLYDVLWILLLVSLITALTRPTRNLCSLDTLQPVKDIWLRRVPPLHCENRLSRAEVLSEDV